VIIWTVLLPQRWRASSAEPWYANASLVKQHTVYLVKFRVSGTICLRLYGQTKATANLRSFKTLPGAECRQPPITPSSNCY
jgi:hypothetical protein